jgi:glycosyltransferase involved in cell wall biosynthesis
VKGLELLLSAWHQLEQAFPDWRLIIAGPCENAYGTKIKAMARELGCRRVEFPGAVFGETKQSAYASADLFILPSHSESFGLVVAEALARRVPVITTLDTPWHGLKKHGCGWCVESTEATILETLRIAMAKNPAELSKMGVRGRDWMEQEYSWARVTDMTVTTYQWLFQRGVIPKFINEK